MAGPDLTDGRDALAYLVADGEETALIDSGAGPSYQKILDLIQAAGHAPSSMRYLIATHCHIDHAGALADFVRDYAPVLVAHSEDAAAIEAADPRMTAASWYGLTMQPVRVDMRLDEERTVLSLGASELICLHAPGHTPGSMVVVLDRDGRRYLFGQDVHGPFDPEFKSDKTLWRRSMERLLELEADVLCEGHYGTIRGRDNVAAFIRGFLDRIH